MTLRQVNVICPEHELYAYSDTHEDGGEHGNWHLGVTEFADREDWKVVTRHVHCPYAGTGHHIIPLRALPGETVRVLA